MESIETLYKMNSFQTKLTDQVKNSVPREVWLELIDILSSITFIKNLISTEDIRGYAKDKPKSKDYNDGRIEVDLTNPHILEDMDFFREKALFFEKHGKYTNLTPNPNPKSEYGTFWKQELHRWKYGLVRPSDGEWIPGELYFYWNYSPIWLVEQAGTQSDGTKSQGERVRKFAKPWLGDYLFHHYVEQCKRRGKHGKMLKCRGVGAELPNTEMVKTINGEVTVGSVKAGDKLIGIDGKETTVLEVYPQGIKDVYNVTLMDGRIVRCGINHLWYVNDSTVKRIRPVKLSEMIEKGLYWNVNNGKNKMYKYKIPKLEPVIYPEKNLPIEPYVLGSLLGDDSLTGTSVRIATDDLETVTEFEKLLPGFELKKDVSNNNYIIIDKDRFNKLEKNNKYENSQYGVNSLKREIKLLGLDVTTGFKFIPEIYKLSSVEQRLELLKGLMDTDGYVSVRGNKEFTNSNLRLIKDVVNIVRSLGMKCRLSHGRKPRQKTIKGKLCNIKQEYRLHIITNDVIFKLPRKIERCKLRSTFEEYPIIDIVKLDYKEESTCFFMDNETHTFLTTDFVPTHNSFKAASWSPRNIYVYPGSGNPNFHLASDKGFLSGDKGIWGKIVDCLDWIAETTPLERMRVVDRAGSTLEIQLGFKDEYGVRKGNLASVHGISLKDNPDKARGIRGPLIHYEEDGLFNNLEKAWNVNRKAVEDGNTTFGFMIAMGCLTKNNLVWTNDGRLLPIHEITKEDGIVGYNGINASQENINWLKDPSIKECIRITTSGGDFVECSIDHPLLNSRPHWRKDIRSKTTRNYVGKFLQFSRADEIKVGDQLITIDDINIFGEESIENARLLGLMIGDGCYAKNRTPTISCGDIEIINYIKDNYDYRIKKVFTQKNGRLYNEFSLRKSTNIFKDAGISGDVKEFKKLPANIHLYNKESLALLIGGYYDADGNITYNEKRKQVRITLTSKYESLLREVKMQLVKFGIHSKISKEFRKDGYKPNTYVFRLYISNYNDVLRFKNNIPLLCSHKNNNLDKVVFMSKIDRTRLPENHTGYFRYREDFQKGDYFKNKEDLVNIRHESVTKIEYIGKQEVYNLNTSITNTYLGNNFITGNTGGVEGGSFEGSEKLFYSPGAYNVYGIPNVFDKNATGDTLCGFFWGAYMNRKNCYDEEIGEPDIIKALIEILLDRHLVKYSSTDPSAITQKKAEECITPQDAIMRTEGTVFPVSDLKDYLESIMVRKESFLAEHYVGELVRTSDGKLKWRLNNDKFPLRSYDKDNANREGCLEIFEMPSENANGEIAYGRYIAGIDPIDADSGTSLFSIIVMDLFTDRIVAEFSGRPRLAEEAYEIALRTLEFYNATANYEKNLKGLFSYFDKKNALFRLCDTPQILKDMQMTKDMGYGNTSKGTMANAEVNKWGRKLHADWMNTSVENEENPGKLKLHTMRGIAHIEEAIKWNSDGNFDRISAAGMLFIIREDRYKRTQSAIANKDKQVETLANDKFFNRNFNQPNAMNGKQIHY